MITEQLEPDATASNRVLSSYLFFRNFDGTPFPGHILKSMFVQNISKSSPRITC